MKKVLTIAGSDCSGGAGIQADIKTMTVHKIYAMSVITALTASLTVGSKAIGKNLAIAFSDKIIYAVARVLCIFVPERVFDNKKKK